MSSTERGTRYFEGLLAPALIALVALTACATPYAYTFALTNDRAQHAVTPNGRETLEDADVRAELLVDPIGQHAILIEVTNKTEQVLQADWTKVTMTRSDGLTTTPRPDVDLGWIEPGKTQVARLIPFTLPPSGSAARALEGQSFVLDVPMIVRREKRHYRYSFSVHLQEL